MPGRPAVGTVLEAKLDRGRGPVATVLVRNGTLRVGDNYIFGTVFGKVRAMFDDRGRRSRKPALHPGRSAGPRSAARSRRHVPGGHRSRQGQADRAVPRDEGARSAAGQELARLARRPCTSRFATAGVKELPLIIKADVGGSAEVLADTLQKLSTDKVTHQGHPLRRGRHHRDRRAAGLGLERHHHRLQRAPGTQGRRSWREQENVDIRLHTIIYELRTRSRRHGRPARAGLQGDLPGPRRSSRHLPHSQGGHHRRLLRLGRRHSREAEIRLLRDNDRSSKARSDRSSASRTTSAK